MANRERIFDTLGLGSVLWLAGYLASFLLFFYVPHDLVGWILYAVFTPVTIYVAYWRFHKRALSRGYFLIVAAVWTMLAIALDYVFIVMLLNSQNYYQQDVLLYYLTIFLIPIGTGLKYAKKK